MDINLIVKITSRAWALTILALLHSGVPGRQAPLIAASDASRTAFGQSLKHLLDLGLVQRTPGHGHPMRSEFSLTEAGEAAGEMACRIMRLAHDTGGQDLLRKTWTLPVLAVTGGPAEFSAIKARLSPITDRALSQTLKSLEKEGWVARSIRDDTRPPKPQYAAIETGARLQAFCAAN